MEKINTRRLLILLAILMAMTVYTYTLRYRVPPQPPPPSLELIPLDVDGYTAREEYIAPESLRLLGADTTIARSYSSGAGDIVQLFIGYFATQQENSQIHSPKHCYPGSGWDIIAESRIELRLDGRQVPVKKLLISDGTEIHLVVYWFSMLGEIVPDEFSLKWHQMKNALAARAQSAAFIRFSMAVTAGDTDRAEDSLARFIEMISPDIQSALSHDGA